MFLLYLIPYLKRNFLAIREVLLQEHIKIIADIGGYDRIVSVIQAKYPAVAMLEAGQAVTLAVKPKDVMIGK